MTDRIALRGVEAFGYHGVLADEKRDGQPFVVDVVMSLDLSRAAASDDLEDTVSYAEVADEVVARITGPSFDLIERLAEVVADDVLSHALVEGVEVTVHKPQAPVGHPFSDVAVSVRRERGTSVVVALGANLGDAKATLEAAVGEVAGLPGIRVQAVSPLVETDPVGGPEQPAYLNAVVLADSALAPAALLAALHRIEDAHGRTRETRWGARTLDLDLVQFGVPGSSSERRSDEPELLLPHPRAHERAFVLVPWLMADVDATLRDGDLVTTVRAALDALGGPDAAGVRPGPEWRPTW